MFLKLPQYVNLNDDFISIDSEETFNHNLRTLPDNWIWRNLPIKYVTNRYGYRTVEPESINWENYSVTFGGSDIFGTGLPADSICTTVLSKRMNIQNLNLGVIAGSPQLSVHSFIHLLTNAPKAPKIVFMSWAPIFRQSWYLDDEVYMWLPQLSHTKNKYRILDETSLNKTLFESHIKTEWIFFQNTVRQLCESKNIKLIEFTMVDDYKKQNIDILYSDTVVHKSFNSDIEYMNRYKARDVKDKQQGHNGIDYHLAFADYLEGIV